MRTVRRFVISLLAAALLVLGVPGHAAAAPTYPGDLEPTFVGWVDESGNPVTQVAPGHAVSAHYTITNALSYPIKVTGVDSELTYAPCIRDFSRRTRDTAPGGQFPIYLAAGQTSPQLTDVPFQLADGSSCGPASPRWMGNVLGEKTESPFPTPSVATATTEVTQTTTVTDHTARSPWPLFVGGGIALLAVLVGLVFLVTRRRR